tara:strand:- start:79 stop:708 length:630 start_codon:yes stop_codon:yes gene_type:complete
MQKKRPGPLILPQKVLIIIPMETEHTTSERGNMETAKAVHRFEAAGLGKAPFRYVGVEERRAVAVQTADGFTVSGGAPGQPTGTCDFCGTGIAQCCVVRSADGREFIVGNSCIEKVGDLGLKQAAAKDLNKMKRDLRHASEAKRIENAKVLMADPKIQAALKAEAHPNEWRASKGETKFDSFEWMMKNAGNAGMIRIARQLEKLAKELA